MMRAIGVEQKQEVQVIIDFKALAMIDEIYNIRTEKTGTDVEKLQRIFVKNKFSWNILNNTITDLMLKWDSMKEREAKAQELDEIK